MGTSGTAQPEKLSPFTKLAFGAGDLDPAIVSGINGFFLNAFLLDVAGLRPAMAGTIFLIVKVWDAVNDPLIGSLSDRTRTRWGRRRPWLLFGAVPFGLFFLLQWVVPPVSDVGKSWYYLVVALCLDAAFTAVNVPYTSLTPGLSRDCDERASLSSYRMSFSILGSVTAASLHSVIVGTFAQPGDPRGVYTGHLVSGAIWATLITVPSLITFAFTRERHHPQTRSEGPGFLEGPRIAFRNRAYLAVIAIYLLAWLAVQFVQSNLILYVGYWADAERYFPILILAVQLSGFLYLGLESGQPADGQTGHLSHRHGLLDRRVTHLALRAAGANRGSLCARGTRRRGVSISYLIPWSMLPDVIELDELETGQRREGVFYGFFVFLQKLGMSLGLVISNFALEASGHINQVPGQPLPLPLFVSAVPAGILLGSFLAVRAYPITRERHAEIRAMLRQRDARTHAP